ncbi:uncharacterized protein LOC127868657 isoform X2 [Dreissena polymorpha]|uniref:Uncharacterized protein n=1 Tax=Dreissena polymorpha TaxID=45954 RepID=A0A9D4MAJ0_DREPO|nr:uncharacterized protein LOC127868657 isoform X2 [Dreissena polymorpha]KAH3872022.1 hypothetical protein DPMN_035235 [Dreissena polymorpha]
MPQKPRSRCKSRQLSPSQTRSGRKYTSTTSESTDASRQCFLGDKKNGSKEKNGSRPSTRCKHSARKDVAKSFHENDSNASTAGKSTNRSDDKIKNGRKTSIRGLRTFSGQGHANRTLHTPTIVTHRTRSSRTVSSAGENAKAPGGSRKRVRRKQRRREVEQIFVGPGLSYTRSGQCYADMATDSGEMLSCHRGVPKQTRIQQHIRELKNRIHSLPFPSRPLPPDDDFRSLVTELKMRLAATSPLLSESGSRGGLIKVSARTSGQRLVPIWTVDRAQEHVLVGHVKVKVDSSGRGF